MNSIIPLLQAKLRQEDLKNIPFDDFYMFFEENRDFDKGKLVADVLLEKFKTAFEEGTLPQLASPFDSKWNLNDAKKRADEFFSAHEQNRTTLNARAGTRIELMHSLQDYHLGNIWSSEEKRRQGLEVTKDILQPFFTEALKVEEAPQKPVKKNFLQRMFGHTS